MSRIPVVVLHSYQLLGPGLRAAFPSDRFDVQVMTFGSSDKVFRSDLPSDAMPVRHVPAHCGMNGMRDMVPQGAEIVTNDEACLPICAGLRVERGLPARQPTDLIAYSNKLATKARLAEASIPVPAFRALELDAHQLAEECARTIDALGLPLVVKPEAGGYNEGVSVLAQAKKVKDWFAAHVGQAGWQAESYVSGRLFHANAMVLDGIVTPVQVGAYASAPLGASHGEGLGSVTLPWGHPIRNMGMAINDEVARALGTGGRFVLHTEFFVDNDRHAYVVDVAARAPGALVSDIAAIHAEVNLEAASFLLQMGMHPAAPRETGVVAGWLWSPPRADDSVSCFLTWNRRFDQILLDMEQAAIGMGAADGLPWLRALRER